MTVGVVGCGLIGGSIGLACRANGHTVIGYELNKDSSRVALERGCVNEMGSLEAAAQADICFICVPPGSVESMVEQVLDAKPAHTTATDCTSVKGSVLDWLKTQHL